MKKVMNIIIIMLQGRKTVRDRKILEVHVDKGMTDGQKIVFSGEGDQEPELEPGDLVIVLDEKEHEVSYISFNFCLHTALEVQKANKVSCICFSWLSLNCLYYMYLMMIVISSFQTFKRSGHDLIIRLNIELVEALCGFQKVIRTLDDRDIVITVLPGEVTKHGEIKCVLNEGVYYYLHL